MAISPWPSELQKLPVMCYWANSFTTPENFLETSLPRSPRSQSPQIVSLRALFLLRLGIWLLRILLRSRSSHLARGRNCCQSLRSWIHNRSIRFSCTGDQSTRLEVDRTVFGLEESCAKDDVHWQLRGYQKVCIAHNPATHAKWHGRFTQESDLLALRMVHCHVILL